MIETDYSTQIAALTAENRNLKEMMEGLTLSCRESEENARAL